MSLWEMLNRRKEPSSHIDMDMAGKIQEIKTRLKEAQAIVIGAGSGLSAAAGFTYEGERFEKCFPDFIEKYGMTDMYSAGFFPFETQEEKWAYWSRHIYYNRYDTKAAQTYLDLLGLVKEKNYFVLTTNVDHQFQIAGFDNKRIFATQGDYGYFQCGKACHSKLYDNEAQVRAMVAHQKNCRIPSFLVPKCPVCGGNMEVNLRCDSYFVEDASWHEAAKSYEEFLQMNQGKNTVFLELGVGMNTPGIIKYPFWNMAGRWEHPCYICLNKGQAWAPEEIGGRSVCLDEDIAVVLKMLGGEENG